MDKGLHLLMRDGQVRVEFTPGLTTEQYSELLHVVQKLSGRATIADLKLDVDAAAQRWGVRADLAIVQRRLDERPQ